MDTMHSNEKMRPSMQFSRCTYTRPFSLVERNAGLVDLLSAVIYGHIRALPSNGIQKLLLNGRSQEWCALLGYSIPSNRLFNEINFY
jgi:hypothetical protein